MNDQFESNYALLVRSEEKGRGVLEILIYAVFFLGVVSSIGQFAQTSAENRCAWSPAVRSLPHDYDTAFCTELM